MNRCIRQPVFLQLAAHLLLALLVIGVGVLVSFPTESQAQSPVRPFPASAKRGVLEVKVFPTILINGEAIKPFDPLYLHPDAEVSGAHIFGEDISTDAKQIRSLVGYMPERDSFIAKMSAVRFVRLMAELSDASSPVSPDKSRVFRRLVKMLRPYWGAIAVALVLLLISMPAELFPASRPGACRSTHADTRPPSTVSACRGSRCSSRRRIGRRVWGTGLLA